MTNKIKKMTGRRIALGTGFIAALIMMAAFFFGAKDLNAAGRKISKNKAESIAAHHAGFKKSKVKFIKAEYDNKDNEYDIEFVKGNYKYDYDINAGNGKIKSQEKDKINCVKKTSSKYISVKKDKKIALNKAKFKASQVTFTKIKMDKENGKKVYEIEFVKGKKEYDYTINAKTGKVMSVDIDVF